MSRGAKRKANEIDPSLLRKERLILICEWESCRELYEDMEAFLAHIANHASQVKIETVTRNEEQVQSFTCLWEECEYQTTNDKEVLRHLYYHAYHTKVKSLGATLIERLGLQGCQMGPHNRNTIPELPEPFICGWIDCSLEFLNVQHFYWHIHTHAGEMETGQLAQCQWEGCASKFSSRSKLKDHLRFHSQERPISCPTCGTLFASRTKLHDHCLRQLPAEAQEYQCPECNKKLSTERILRDHIRCHQAMYDCPYCPEDDNKPSFWNKSALASHVKYCHSDARPFVCTHPECSHRAKSQGDLTRHLETHSSSTWYYCQNPGCEFTAQSVQTLQRHIRSAHEEKSKQLYGCHECDQRFQASNSLRRHLVKKHGMQPTTGSGRFRYHLGEDGVLRVRSGSAMFAQQDEEYIEFASEEL